MKKLILILICFTAFLCSANAQTKSPPKWEDFSAFVKATQSHNVQSMQTEYDALVVKFQTEDVISIYKQVRPEYNSMFSCEGDCYGDFVVCNWSNGSNCTAKLLGCLIGCSPPDDVSIQAYYSMRLKLSREIGTQ